MVLKIELYIHSDQICPNIISSVATETTSEKNATRVETRKLNQRNPQSPGQPFTWLDTMQFGKTNSRPKVTVTSKGPEMISHGS